MGPEEDEEEPILRHAASPEDVAVQQRLLLSQVATKLGRKAWFFCAPFFLMWFAPGTLLGPGLFGMTSFGARLLLGPRLGTWADARDRLDVVRTGVALQALAATGNFALILAAALLGLAAEGHHRVTCLCLACFLGVLEKLSFPLMDVPVKRDWVPTLFMHDTDLLARTNLRLSQIDLGTVVVSPLIAGLALELPALCGGQFWGVPADTVGYLIVGWLNALSCLPQYLLLRQVYQLRQDKLARVFADKVEAENVKSRESPLRGGALRTWFRHPFGVPLLSLSYALLYFTVLSPQGSLFTAYLAQAGMPAMHLSWIRGAGAVGGLLGVGARSRCLLLLSERLVNTLAVGSLALFMILANVFLHLPAQSHSHEHAGLHLYLFAACVVLGRPGLMAFELGVLNQAQVLVDEGSRAAVGFVDDALQSGFTLAVYGLNTIFHKPDDFGGLVGLSAAAGSSGCLAYIAWCSLYQEHRHWHDRSSSSSEGFCMHEHGQDAVWQGPCHSEHPHTSQAVQDVEKDGWHSHLIFQPFWHRPR